VGHRGSIKHEIFSNGRNHRDDRIETLYLQLTSQLDGLRHARFEGAGFYNGVPDEEIVEGTGRLGIGGWARHGIVGRAVLIDVEAHLRQARGHGLDHDGAEQIEPDVLDAALAAQGCELAPGSIVLMRTGWLSWYRDVLTDEERIAFPSALRGAGLAQSEAVVSWLWDRRVALFASDNPGVEALPVRPDSPFLHPASGQDGFRAGMAHPTLIALLGLALGELWELDGLAAACHADGRYESMLVANPLLLDAAVGSPANVVAIR
jgi:kynurenine formamidase